MYYCFLIQTKILLVFLVFIAGITSFGRHKTLKKAPATNSWSQKCDLLCPGQPSYPLPPNFLQNCTSPGSQTQKPSNSPSQTTIKTTSTTEEDQGEEEGSIEEPNNNSTSISYGISNGTRKNGKKQVRYAGIIAKKLQQKNSHHASSSIHHNNKNKNEIKLKKKQVRLTPQGKSLLMKHHRKLSGKSKLNSCKVVCTENNDTENGAQAGNNDNDAEESGGDEEESSGEDNYVQGEDSPIEIIYVPQINEDNRRPSELYQINNYGLVPPAGPALNAPANPGFDSWDYGFDPVFFQDKHKNAKKRKHHNMKNKKLQENKQHIM